MPAGPNVSTLSIRVPRQLREIIAAACEETDQSRAEFISSTGAMAAKGVLKSSKCLKLLPDWFKLNGDERKMMTITMYPEDLELTKSAAGKMGMIPHTRFILWAVVLMSLATLGQKEVEKISRRVVKTLKEEAEAEAAAA